MTTKETWYIILIDGYSWYINSLEDKSGNIKIAETVGGQLSEGHYTKNQMSQIRAQIDDYERLGFNSRIAHLKDNGIYQIDKN
jgi:hypothetical protein